MELFLALPVSRSHLIGGERSYIGVSESALPVWFPGEDTDWCPRTPCPLPSTMQWRVVGPGFRVRELGLYSRSAAGKLLALGRPLSTRSAICIVVLHEK